MKNLTTITFLGLSMVIFLFMLSCQDKFNEQDFLITKAKQDSIALNKLTILNEAGELLSFSVQILEDNKPLSGVKVKLSNVNIPAGVTPMEITTNDDGIALFSSVKYGAFNIILSKTDYMPATVLVTVDYPIVRDADNNIIPVKINESVVLSMVSKASATGSAVATIKGKVSIESDLTNDKPEVPQNLVLKADLTGLGFVLLHSSNTHIEDYVYNEGGIGIATVNANGEYSMTVPATAQGLFVSMVYPTIELNQRIAINHLDGKEIEPQYRLVPTVFDNRVAYDDIPYIPGATAVLTALPTTPGTGLTFAFSPFPRSLGNSWFSQAASSEFTQQHITYSITNRGSGYQSSPVMEFGAGANKATFRASLRGTIKEILVSNVGGGYPGIVTATISFKDNNGGNYFITSFPVSTVGGALPSTITLPTTGIGFDPITPFTTDNGQNFAPGFDVKEFIVAFSGNPTTIGTAKVSANAEVDGIQMINGGSGFVSNPGEPTITGGIGGSGFVFKIKNFYCQWSIDVSNGGSNYKILPDEIGMAYVTENGSSALSWEVLDRFNTTSYMISTLRTSSNAVSFLDPTNSYRTTGFSETAPESVISTSISAPAKIEPTVGSDFDTFSYGKVGLNVIGVGSGYNTAFGVVILPTIAGAPGSDAAFRLTGFSKSPTSEYHWNGSYIRLNDGGGYLPNLNRVNEYVIGNPISTSPQFFYGSNSFLVKTGAVIINDVTYGTGDRKEEVFVVFH